MAHFPQTQSILPCLWKWCLKARWHPIGWGIRLWSTWTPHPATPDANVWFRCTRAQPLTPTWQTSSGIPMALAASERSRCFLFASWGLSDVPLVVHSLPQKKRVPGVRQQYAPNDPYLCICVRFLDSWKPSLQINICWAWAWRQLRFFAKILQRNTKNCTLSHFCLTPGPSH